MGFGGSAAAMIQVLRNNSKQLAQRDKYFDKKVNHGNGSFGRFVDHKKMTAEELQAFKLQLAKKRKNKTIKTYVIVLISLLVALFLLYLSPSIIEFVFDPSYQDVEF